MLLIACVSSQTGRSDMASHVSSSGLQLGGASNDTASPLTQGEAPHFNSPAMVKTASFRQERPNFPRPLFPSNLPWQGTLSLLTDCAQHCSLLRPRPPTA